MKIKVDEEKCIGCGTCQLVCPDCFFMEDNVAKIKTDGCAGCDPKEAAENCPVAAIEVEK